MIVLFLFTDQARARAEMSAVAALVGSVAMELTSTTVIYLFLRSRIRLGHIVGVVVQLVTMSLAIGLSLHWDIRSQQVWFLGIFLSLLLNACVAEPARLLLCHRTQTV